MKLLSSGRLLSIFLPAFLILISLLFIYSVFQSSDDAWQSLLNAGYIFWDYPMVNPIITSPGFTSIIVFLNKFLPFYSWHGIILLFFHYLVLVALLRITLHYQPIIVSIFIFALYFFIIHLNFIAFLHYTATGVLSCCLSLILIFIKPSKNRVDWLLGFVLFLFGSFLRPEAAIFSILLIGWAFIIPLFSKQYALWILQVKHLMILVLITLGINITFYVINNRDGSWSNYLSFHYKYAKPILDNDYLHYDSKTSILYNEIGWSENDYNILTNWYFGDTITFNYKKIAKLYELAQLSKGISTNRNLSNGLEEIKFHFRQSQYFQLEFGIFLLLFSLLVIKLFREKSIHHIWKILPYFFISTIFILYLAFFMKLPPWVIQPIFAVLIILILTQLPSIKISTDFKSKAILILVSSIISIGLLAIYHKRGVAEKSKFETFKTFISLLKPKTSDIYWITTDFPLTSIPALVDLRFLKELKGYPVTTICQTPFAFKRIKQRNMGNPSRFLFENENAKALCSEKFCVMFKTYVKEHYNKDIEYKNTMPYQDFGNTFGVYKFKEILN